MNERNINRKSRRAGRTGLLSTLAIIAVAAVPSIGHADRLDAGRVQMLLASASPLSNDDMAGTSAQGLPNNNLGLPDSSATQPRIRLWDEFHPQLPSNLQDQQITITVRPGS